MRFKTLNRWGLRNAARIALAEVMCRLRGWVARLASGGVRAGNGFRVYAGVHILCCDFEAQERVTLGPQVRLTGQGRIRIGARSVVNARSTLDSADAITIGARVLIGPNCYIVDSNHARPARGMPLVSAHVETKPVLISDDVWIGQGVTILPGVSIGQGAVVGAGAVVTRDVAAYDTVVGVPARSLATPHSAN